MLDMLLGKSLYDIPTFCHLDHLPCIYIKYYNTIMLSDRIPRVVHRRDKSIVVSQNSNDSSTVNTI